MSGWPKKRDAISYQERARIWYAISRKSRDNGNLRMSARFHARAAKYSKKARILLGIEYEER